MVPLPPPLLVVLAVTPPLRRRRRRRTRRSPTTIWAWVSSTKRILSEHKKKVYDQWRDGSKFGVGSNIAHGVCQAWMAGWFTF